MTNKIMPSIMIVQGLYSLIFITFFAILLVLFSSVDNISSAQNFDENDALIAQSASEILVENGFILQGNALERLENLSTLQALHLSPSQLYRIDKILDSLAALHRQYSDKIKAMPLNISGESIKSDLIKRKIPQKKHLVNWHENINEATEIISLYQSKELEYISGIILLLNDNQRKLLHLDPARGRLTLPWNIMRETLTLDISEFQRRGANILKPVIADLYSKSALSPEEINRNLFISLNRARNFKGDRISRGFYEIAGELNFNPNKFWVENTAKKVFSGDFASAIIKDMANLYSTTDNLLPNNAKILGNTVDKEKATSLLSIKDYPPPSIPIIENIKKFELLNLLNIGEKQLETITGLCKEFFAEGKENAKVLAALALEGYGIELCRFILAGNSPGIGETAKAQESFQQARNIVLAQNMAREKYASLISMVLNEKNTALIRSSVAMGNIFLPYNELVDFLSMPTIEFRRNKVDLANSLIDLIVMATRSIDKSLGENFNLPEDEIINIRRSIIRILEISHDKAQKDKSAINEIVYSSMRDILLEIPVFSIRRPVESAICWLFLSVDSIDILESISKNKKSDPIKNEKPTP